MDKVGGGLSIDSDHHLHHNFFFFNKAPFYKSKFMDSPTVQFNLSSSSYHDQETNTNEHKHKQQQQQQQREEMDFFSTKNSSHRDVKKEVSLGASQHAQLVQPSPPKFNFDVNTGLNLLTANTSNDKSMVDDRASANIEKNEVIHKAEINQSLEVLQAELDRLNEENQRLKGMLNQVSNNYNTLQMHLVTLMQQQNQKSEEHDEIVDDKLDDKKHEVGDGMIVPRQFMDLGLAATAEMEENSQTSSDERRRDHSRSPVNNLEVASKNNEIVPFDQDGRRLNKDDSPDDHESQGWVPNKTPKLNGPSKNVEPSTEATMRKARVSVRARSEAPMITDGCQWRKYGQKMAKGNPCPRAYYRCTMAAGCPVRKQVQRCADDRTILVTTYEGNHNHPLPPAAMAMANTTSAAASVLLSGSMSSADGIMNSNYLTRTMLPCSSSMATISASAPFPTVTLDLTNSPNPLQFQRPQTQFHLPFLTPPQNFNSTNPQSLAQVFGQSLYNQSKFSGLQVSQNLDPSQAAQFGNQAPPQQGQQPQPTLADTVSAATAAITADPNFTAALAAAISSIINGGGSQQANSNSNTNNNDTNGSNSK